MHAHTNAQYICTHSPVLNTYACTHRSSIYICMHTSILKTHACLHMHAHINTQETCMQTRALTLTHSLHSHIHAHMRTHSHTHTHTHDHTCMTLQACHTPAHLQVPGEVLFQPRRQRLPRVQHTLLPPRSGDLLGSMVGGAELGARG